VTTQAQVLRLLRQLQQERGAAIIFITHDLGVIAQVAHYVMVMYLGLVMEQGPGGRHLPRAEAPLHPGAPALDPEHERRAARGPADDQRVDPAPLQQAAGLPLPPPLREADRRQVRGAHPRPPAGGRRQQVSCFLYHDAEVAV
jgi:ABC-type dipeptide/oligopeptide/nickel transport system ATPase component